MARGHSGILSMRQRAATSVFGQPDMRFDLSNCCTRIKSWPSFVMGTVKSHCVLRKSLLKTEEWRSSVGAHMASRKTRDNDS